MGNALKKSPCHWKKTKLAYIVILKRIFHGSKAYHQIDRKSAIHKKLQKRRHRTNIPEEEAIRLEAYVKSHIKALVDYLESNNNKLGDTGKYVYKKVSKSLDPEVHIIGLIVLRELLSELRRFSYDRDLLCKLMGSGGIDNAVLTKEEKKKLYRQQEQDESAAVASNEAGVDLTLYKNDLMGNIIEFEGSVVETLYFVLDQKRNPYYEASYIYSLQVLNMYVKNHVGYLPVERMEQIGIRVLDIISEYREVETRENLEKCYQILEILIMLANSPSLVFSFKMKFIQYACKILRSLYHEDERVSRMNLHESTEDVKQLKQDTKWKAFELIEVVTQSLSDLNEFDIIIVPIFSFFDETQWTDERLGKDVFVSLLRSMKNYSSFDQIELFVIEKIVDYINYNPKDDVKSLNVFKHNRENEVKIRIFSVLEAVLREVRKSFLSFIIVDKLINCFVNNLEERAAVRLADKRLKETIYSCQRNFLEKIDNSSKSLAQVINSLASQISKKCQDNEANEIQMTELLLFLQFTIEDIHHFPSQIFVPRTAMLSLLKMRAYSNILFKTFPVTEKLLEISYEIEESPDGRMGQRDIKCLPCEFDTSYNLLSDNLTSIKMLIEERKELKSGGITSGEDARFLGFIMHCTRLNDGLLERRDNTLLGIELAFIKEIMNISRDELQVYEKQNNLKAKENSGLLTYLVLRFVKGLSEKWGVDFSSFQSTSLAQRIPLNIIDSAEKRRENMTKDDVLNVFASLRSIQDISSKQYEEESTAFMSFVIKQLQEFFPCFKIDISSMNLNDIDLYKNLNNLNGIVDDDSPDFQSAQGNVNIDDIPRVSNNRKESMAIFNQVVRQEKSSQGQTPVKLEVLEEEEENEDSSASSMLDASFKKALKQSRYSKVHEPNILKLIEDELL